jgi:predicted DNA-binding transcriptional regulator AlpA
MNDKKVNVLGVDDLMKIFKISRPTIYRWCAQKKISHFKFDGGLRFSPVHVSEFLQSRERRSAIS